MLTLSASSAEPYWLDVVPGVRVQVKPITNAAMLIAQRAVGEVFRDEDQDEVVTRASVALVRKLAHLGIVGWEGVGNADGETAPVTPENIDAFLDVWAVYSEIDRAYVAPAMTRGLEKNASANSRPGTSAAGASTALPA